MVCRVERLRRHRAEFDVAHLDGLTLLRRMRDQGRDTPTLLLTVKNEVSDRVAGLRAGADDYLCKPFALDELLARVEALVRSLPRQQASVAAGGRTRGGYRHAEGSSPFCEKRQIVCLRGRL